MREKAMQPSEEGRLPWQRGGCAHRDSIFCRKRFRCLPWEVLATWRRQTSASAPVENLRQMCQNLAKSPSNFPKSISVQISYPWRS